MILFYRTRTGYGKHRDDQVVLEFFPVWAWFLTKAWKSEITLRPKFQPETPKVCFSSSGWNHVLLEFLGIYIYMQTWWFQHTWSNHMFFSIPTFDDSLNIDVSAATHLRCWWFCSDTGGDLMWNARLKLFWPVHYNCARICMALSIWKLSSITVGPRPSRCFCTHPTHANLWQESGLLWRTKFQTKTAYFFDWDQSVQGMHHS